MTELNREFGDLLTQGLKSIAARENKAILALEDELGYDMEATRWSIEKWRQGSVPSDTKKVKFLACACVSRGGMNRHWLLRFLSQSHFPNKETLMQELFAEVDQTSPQVRRNIPGRPYDQFVGREKELTELQRFLSPTHRVGVICLSGMAGVGKTALAIEIAHRSMENYTALSLGERFEAIVWVTAKQTELLPTGLANRHPTFKDLDSLYRAIAEVLDIPAITRAVTHEDRDIIVMRALTERRILIVLDNLEDIDDPSLMIFLRDLPTPSKAIVTTRHRIGVAVTLQLKAFNETEARELIYLGCHRYNLSLSSEQTEKLLQRTGCLALAIVRTVGRMAWRRSSVEAELRQLGDPTNAIYDFCFEKSIAIIRDSDAHKLFMALALFVTDATREALGYVAGFQQNILDRDDGLSDIEVLSLVSKEGDCFSLEPLTKVKAQLELTHHQSFKLQAQIRRIEWYKNFIGRIEKATSYSLLQVEIDNVVSVIDELIEQRQMIDVTWFFRRIRKFLFAEGRWELLIPFSEQVAAWAESINDTETLADTLDSLTRVFREQGDFARAHDWLEHIQQLNTSINDELLQAEVWVTKAGIMYRQDTNPEEELSNIPLLSWAVEVFRSHDQTDRIIDALNTLGNLHLKQRHFEDASVFFQEGLRVLENTRNDISAAKQWRAALRGNISQIASQQGQYAKARKEMYEVLNDFSDQTDFAEAYMRLALCEFHLGNTEQAHHLRKQAKIIIERLNLLSPLCVEDEEWLRLRIDLITFDH